MDTKALYKHLLIGASGAIALPFALVAPVAQAQADTTAQSTSEDPNAFNTIVVTAQKRAESVNDVPLAITAVSGEDLARNGITSTEDLVKIVPSLTVAKSHTNTPIYTLRGVGFQTQNLTATSPVGVYVDEVSYAYPYMASNVAFDLQRVEVLKGPQGTLYGRSTTGGVVNFITARPEPTPSGSVTLEAGNYQTFGLEGYVTGPLTDTLSLRLAGTATLAGKGWQRSVTRPGDRLGEKERTAARASLLWTPSSDLEALLTVSYWKDNSDTQAPQAIAYTPANPAFTDPRVAASLIPDPSDARDADWTPRSYQPTTARTRSPYRSDGRFFGTDLRIDYHLTDTLSLTSLTAYNDVRRNDITSVDGTAIEVLTSGNSGSVKSFSQELRLSGENGPVEWMVGGYYAHDTLSEALATYNYDASAAAGVRAIDTLLKVNPAMAAAILGVPAGAVDGFSALAQYNTAGFSVAQLMDGFHSANFALEGKSQSLAVFGNTQFTISDTLSFTAGARYTHDTQDNVSCAYDLNGNSLGLGVFLATVVLQQPATLSENMCLTTKSDYSGFSDPIEGHLSESNLSFRGSLNWTPNRDILAYATFARGYKSGGFPALAANVASQLDPVTAERLDDYEVGLKAAMFNHRVQLNLAGFYYDYRDKQVRAIIPDPVFGVLNRLVNLPKTQVYGAEAELSAYLTDSLHVRLAATYVHSEIKDFTGYDGSGQARDFAGAQLAFTPEWTAVGAIDYKRAISDTLDFDISLSGNYQSASNGRFNGGTRTSAQAQQDALYYIKGRTIFDLTAGIGNHSWKLQGYVRNLFDTYYWTTADSQVDIVYRFAGMPRTYGARLSFNF